MTFSITPGDLEPFRQEVESSHDRNIDAEEQVRILLVEDEPAILILFEKILALRGWQVFPVDNADDAIRHWEEGNIDIIFMDLQLPKMNGLEATRIIRRLEAERGKGRIPIIAVTAWCRPEDRSHCLDAGMDDYIAKPIHKNELYSMVDKYLAKESD